MSKLVMDSDGLIKLTKSGIIQEVLDVFDCLISEEVEEECVTKGKDCFYEDAFQIGTLIEENKLRVLKTGINIKAQEMLKNQRLGAGERSTLHLFLNVKAKAIISDDQTFLNFLYQNRIPFVIPSDLIARLVELKILDKKGGLLALEKMKPYIKESNYLKARKKVELVK